MTENAGKATKPSGGAWRTLLWSALVIVLIFIAGLAWYARPRSQTFLTDGDTIRQSAKSAPIRDILWQPPAPLDEIINTTDEDYEPRLSWDGMTLYFVRGRAGGNSDIYLSKRTPSGWTPPEPLSIVNTDHDELGPEPSADGRSLYFYSDRPGGSGGYDLWVMRFEADGRTPIGAPANLGPMVNSPYNDYGPALSPDGGTIYFASNRPPPVEAPADPDAWPATVREDLTHRTYDLYAAPITDAGHGLARALDALNTPYNDGPAALSPVGDFLYFSSDRPGGEGGFDLYRARRMAGGFDPPTNLGSPVNTAANELDPGLTQLGYALYFSSDRRVAVADADAEEAKDYNLYYSSSREVFRDVEVQRASIDWGALWDAFGPNLLLALLALLLLLLLLRMMRGIQGRRLSLLARCLLASLVAHILLMLLLNVWQVTSSVAGLLGGRKEKIRIAMTSPTQGDAITAQLLSALTEVDAPAFEAHEAERLESQPTMLDAATLDPSRNIEVERAPIEVATEVHVDERVSEATPTEQHELTFDPTPPDQVELDRAVALATPEESSRIADAEAPSEAPRPARSEHETRPTVAPSESRPEPMVRTEMAASPIEALVDRQDAEKLIAEADARESTPANEPNTPVSHTATRLTQRDIESDLNLPVADVREAVEESTRSSVDARLPDAQRDRSAIQPDGSSSTPSTLRQVAPRPVGAQLADARLLDESTMILADAESTDALPQPSTATAPAFVEQPDSMELPTLEASQRITEPEPAPSVEAARRMASRMAPATPDEADRPAAAMRQVAPSPRDAEPVDQRLASAAPSRRMDAVAAPVPMESPELPTDVHAETDSADSFELPALEVADRSAPSEPVDDAAARPIPRALTDAAPRSVLDPGESASRAINEMRDVQPADVADAAESAPFDAAPGTRVADAAPTAPDVVPQRPIDAPLPDVDDFALPSLEVASSSPTDDSPDTAETPSSIADATPAPRADAIETAMVESVRVALAPTSRSDTRSLDRTLMDPADAVRDSLRALRDPTPPAPATAVDSPLDPGAFDLSLPVESIPPENPYIQRSEENRRAILERLGGSEETEAAVAGALRWLANHQSDDGRWDADGFDASCGECGGETNVKADVALTGLALLCFLGANHTPGVDGPYRDNVERAVEWLLDRQQDDGDLRDGESMYSQGIATIAIAEAAGMTGDSTLMDPVERAADYIVRARSRSPGGWRYEPGQPGDTSVLGWQVMALKSARNAGVVVNPVAFSAARDWLESVSTAEHPGLYAYQPGHSPTHSMTAEGMFIQQLLGRSANEPRMVESARFLESALPMWDSNQNTYYWYYGTLAAFQHQGALWSKWNPAIKRELLDHQIREGKPAGSWDPKDQYALLGGRVYQTALCTLMLEVYYRYLPMYGPEAPADAIGQIRGVVTDATTGRSISGATVKLDLPDRDPQIASTGRDGGYTLFPPQMPDFFALSAVAPGYVPRSINVPSSRLEGNILQVDFDLTRMERGIIPIEAFPTVHHLGNNRWEGRINSQFQKEAEGVMYEATFEIAEDQLPPHFSGSAIAMMAKGVQCPPHIWINDQRIDHDLDESPRDGSFGEFEFEFDIDTMHEGENTVRIRTTSCRGDLDDWEFVNVQIRLSP